MEVAGASRAVRLRDVTFQSTSRSPRPSTCAERWSRLLELLYPDVLKIPFFPPETHGQECDRRRQVTGRASTGGADYCRPGVGPHGTTLIVPGHDAPRTWRQDGRDTGCGVSFLRPTMMGRAVGDPGRWDGGDTRRRGSRRRSLPERCGRRMRSPDATRSGRAERDRRAEQTDGKTLQAQQRDSEPRWIEARLVNRPLAPARRWRPHQHPRSDYDSVGSAAASRRPLSRRGSAPSRKSTS